MENDRIEVQCAQDHKDTILIVSRSYGDVEVTVSEGGMKTQVYLTKNDLSEIMEFLSKHRNNHC